MTHVKIYSTPTCPYCQQAKKWLAEKGVDFDDIDVSQDREAARQMVEKSGEMGVPQIEVNGKMIVGFNKEALEQEIGGDDAVA